MEQKTHVFRSAEAVPAHLRKRMATTAKRGQSATILIADRKGKQELARAVRGLPSRVNLRASLRVRKPVLKAVASLGGWIDIGLLGIAGLLIWIAATL
jgi:hypothetical protein